MVKTPFDTSESMRNASAMLAPSARSNVPPFMVMDVMQAAAALEARGKKIIHMEVGQPGTPAPKAALAAVAGALPAEGIRFRGRHFGSSARRETTSWMT